MLEMLWQDKLSKEVLVEYCKALAIRSPFYHTLVLFRVDDLEEFGEEKGYILALTTLDFWLVHCSLFFVLIIIIPAQFGN